MNDFLKLHASPVLASKTRILRRRFPMLCPSGSESLPISIKPRMSTIVRDLNKLT